MDHQEAENLDVFTDTTTLIERALSKNYFTGEEPAIPSLYQAGQGNVLIVTGENAGGKSFFRRILQELCSKTKVECMHISMEGRRNIGISPWLTLVYGNEGHSATGVLSASTVQQGIRTVNDRETPHVIIWDEPDIGASDSTAASMGEAIAQCFSKPLPNTLSCVVITHRKSLVERLLPVSPHYLYLGNKEGPKTIEDWLKEPIRVRTLDEIYDQSRERYRAIADLIPKKPVY